MIAVAWLAELVALAYRDWHNPSPIPIKGQQPYTPPKHLVYPNEIVSTFIIFGALGFMDGTSFAPVGAAVAWGFVLATALSIWNPAAPTTVGGAP